MTLRLSEAARDDLRAIYRYYAERSPASVGSVVGTILKAANGLTRFPLMGKQGAIEGTRERIVTRYPYRIVYILKEDTLIVPRILHSARTEGSGVARYASSRAGSSRRATPIRASATP